MNDADLINRARALAISKGGGDLADDFSQEAWITLNRGRKATLKQLMVDFMRQETEYNRITKKTREKVSTDHEDFFESKEFSQDFPEFEPDFETYLQLLKGEERVYFVLKYFWDLTEKEIGYCFGVSESRISQKMKVMKDRLKTVLKRKGEA